MIVVARKEIKKLILSLSVGILSATASFAQEMNVAKGLEMWLKADAIDGIKDGGAVATWLDSSGKKADVSAPDGKQPLFNANFANGKPGLVFSGAQGMLSSKKYSFKDFTVFVVFLVDGTPVHYERLVDHGFTSGFWLGRNGVKVDSWGGGIKDVKHPYGNFSSFSVRSPSLMIFSRKGGVQSIAGTCASPVQGNVSADKTNENTIAIGFQANSAERNLTGRIAEVLVYSEALSDDDMKTVGTYLRKKYDLAGAVGNDSKAKQEEEAVKMKEIESMTVTVMSSKDNTPQRMLYYAHPEAAKAQKGEAVPLLVFLHSWNGNCSQGMEILPEVKQRKWVFAAPNFRGPNTSPQACASESAIKDVLDAVDYARKNARIDDSRIYLLGGSGGGHMALMMAAKAPSLWAAVSAWVPITDLARWHAENLISHKGYDKSLEKVCGGAPGKPETDREYRARSPLFFLEAAKGLPIDINAGISDGHKGGSVPISHSLRAFNVLAKANGLNDKLLAEEDIAFMTEKEKIPETLASEKENDLERRRTTLFRRISGPVRITIFEGGHEGEYAASYKWFSRQRKGKPVVWRPKIEDTSSFGNAEVKQVAP